MDRQLIAFPNKPILRGAARKKVQEDVTVRLKRGLHLHNSVLPRLFLHMNRPASSFNARIPTLSSHYQLRLQTCRPWVGLALQLPARIQLPRKDQILLGRQLKNAKNLCHLSSFHKTWKVCCDTQRDSWENQSDNTGTAAFRNVFESV